MAKQKQPNEHSYFWTIIPGKTQCGKTDAADEGLYLSSEMEITFTGV